MIYDTEIIDAIIDLCDTVYVGYMDDQWPYVIPMTFGHEIKDDKLLIYLHAATEGYKLKLLAKNPNVCLAFSKLYNYPDRPYKGHLHDYRSVVAFGTMRIILKDKETGLYGRAFQKLLKHYGRKPTQFDPTRVPLMNLYVVECNLNNVTGKTECPVRNVNDVPFKNVYDLPIDEEPYEIGDLIDHLPKDAPERFMK
jgi:nitroimidazol reductase NimA-like FMN-containing flavoprotein (pyridoxamine 5'-phosphate oxidase superfamily)